MSDITEKLRALAALRRGAPLHDSSITEASWLEQAADEFERMEQSLRDGDDLRERMSDILSRIAVALKGQEPTLTRWSWHDLPELAAAAMKEKSNG